MIHIFRVEVTRMLRNRVTWFAAAAALLGFVSGVFGADFGTTMSSMYLAKQTGSGCLIGSAVFALLTLYELDRVPRHKMDTVVDRVVSPVSRVISLQFAIVVISLIAVGLSAVIYAPYAVWKLGIVFSPSDYLLCFFLYVFPAMVFGSLAAAACYNLTRRAEVSALIVTALLLWSGTRDIYSAGYHYLQQWSSPILPAMSDDFSNAAFFRAAAYNRLVWTMILGGAWILSLGAIRQYGKRLIASLLIGARRVWPVAAASVLAVSAVFLWRNEPFLDRSPVDYMEAMMERMSRTNSEGLFLESTRADVDLTDTLLGRIDGTAVFGIRNETGNEQELVLGASSGYELRRVTANGADVPYEDLNNDIINQRDIRVHLPDDYNIELSVEYGGAPKAWNAAQYLMGRTVIDDKAILEVDMIPNCSITADESAVSSADITLPGHMIPVTAGRLPELVSQNADGSATWRGTGMGGVIFAADYVKIDLDGGDTPIEFYYSAKHQEEIERLDAISLMEEAVKYCGETFGPRFVSDEVPLRILQGSELLFGGFASGNISSMSEESFTAENLSDIDTGASGAEVLAHEIIHQWWGLSSSFMDSADANWTEEGITTYTTYRLVKKLKGEEYADRHYKSRWEADVRDMEANFYVRNPEYMDRLPESLRADIEGRLRGVNMYSGYALMFCRAAELLGGEDKLDVVMAKLYASGGTEMPPYISLNDFLSASGLTREALGID